MTLSQTVAKVVSTLIGTEARVATAYLSPTQTVRASRVRYGRKIRTDARSPIDIRLTIGRPNYHARAFIKDMKRAGEPFPLHKVQLEGRKL